MREQVEDSLKDALQKSGKTFKQTRKSFITDCPTCDKEGKCYILKESGGAICFVCGAKWRLRGIIAAILGITFQEAEKSIRGIGGDKHETFSLLFDIQGSGDELTDADFEDDGEIIDYKQFSLDLNFVDVWKSDRGMEYLIKREITNPEVWVRHGLMYHHGMDAVVAPVFMFGVLVGYQARFIQPSNPKFRMKTSTGLPRERALLNFDSASKMDAIIIVEGIFDCLRTDLQHKGVGSMATMGKVLSQGQIELLKNTTAKRIYLGLDFDAWDLIHKLAEEVGKTKEVLRLLPPKNRKDFGECTEEEVIKAMEDALPFNNKTSSIELYVKI